MKLLRSPTRSLNQLLRNKGILDIQDKHLGRQLLRQRMRARASILQFFRDRRINFKSPTVYRLLKRNHKKYVRNLHKLDKKRKQQIRDMT